MGFLEAGRRDPDELAPRLQLGNGGSTGVEHGLAEAAHQLVRNGRQRAAVGHAAFDAFRNQLVVAGDVGLEVAVLGVGRVLSAGLHGPKGTHAAVALELLAVHENELAR
ncbi:hypothetical protein D9M72_377430 [compost metagenome]